MFSERASSVSPSLTLAISAKAKAMKKEGIDVVGFGAGEPDFDTPKDIKEKAKEAIDKGYTKYTPASGLPELKKAIVNKFKKDNNLDYKTDEVIVGCGAKHVIFEIIFSLVCDQDQVVIPSPYWVSYSEMVHILGGKVTIIPTTEKSGFKITYKDLEKVMKKNTKVLLLNSPNNPTGAVYSKEELYSLADYLEDKDIIIISDEIYEKIIYGERVHVSIAAYSEKIKKKTVVVNGVSKAFSSR